MWDVPPGYVPLDILLPRMYVWVPLSSIADFLLLRKCVLVSMVYNYNLRFSCLPHRGGYSLTGKVWRHCYCLRWLWWYKEGRLEKNIAWTQDLIVAPFCSRIVRHIYFEVMILKVSLIYITMNQLMANIWNNIHPFTISAHSMEINPINDLPIKNIKW